MNLIIDLIIKIFQAIFEEDRQRREQEQRAAYQAKLKAARRQGQGQGQAPQAPQPQTGQGAPAGQDPMTAWLEELLGVQTQPIEPHSPPQPLPQPASRQPAPRPVYRQKEARPRFDIEPSELDPHPQEEKKGLERLPGKTPLEQMVYAQVILGPCKAHRNSRIPRKHHL